MANPNKYLRCSLAKDTTNSTKISLLLQYLVVILIAVSCSSSPVKDVARLTVEDIHFCNEKELWDILKEYENDIILSLQDNPKEVLLYDVLETLALMEQDTLKFVDVIDKRLENLRYFNDAMRAAKMLKSYSEELLSEKLATYYKLFDDEAHHLLLKLQGGIITAEEISVSAASLSSYPPEFESYVKRFIDEVAVERNDSLRIVNCNEIAKKFPVSEWLDFNQYLIVVSLLNQGKNEQAFEIISEEDVYSPELAVHYASLLQSSTLRKQYLDGNKNIEMLDKSLQISSSSSFPEGKETVRIGYNYWDKEYWLNKKNLLEAKTLYYKMIYEAEGLWGDEGLIAELDNVDISVYNKGWILLSEIEYDNNDYGEVAELNYWKGRYAVLLKSNIAENRTAEYFIDCLIAGSPRNRFDVSAMKYLIYLSEKRGITLDIMDWCRKIKDYRGPVFIDVTDAAGLLGQKSSRVAVADYDNDGYPDILLNGRLLFRNNGDMTFTNVTKQAGLTNYGFVGGLWADYNKDGNIDIASLSRNTEGEGNTLFKNNGDGTFTADAISHINDFAPTEGAAWVDIDQNGYPSLYTANYEIWQVRAGFEDYFWYNEKGVLSDKSVELGFRAPEYTKNPGLAGRGVSPADYDNDGVQSIFVSNYRLSRNFLWEPKDGGFNDNAALNGLRGHLQQGYYGHTIGADWGDFNNDGNLDIFLCNLAHPRYLDFSDISMLLRNDGAKERKIGERTVKYHQFTDITKEAGITFDELHSDPNWIDTNNNGYLDLYITSIYENDRSYLYLNNGDETFTDITFLSGTRVYNGWGNAAADFDGDGKIDLIVGSGSGVKLFLNVTAEAGKSIFVKPYWDGEEVRIVEKKKWNESIPNSPAFGTKVFVNIRKEGGSTVKLIRELNGGKGTTSQNDQFLHFGFGDGDLLDYGIWRP